MDETEQFTEQPELVSLSAAVPLRPPWVPRVIQGIAAALGIFVGIAVSAVIFSFAPPPSVLGKLFNLSSLPGVVPVVMLSMFAWGGLLCLFRWFRLRIFEQVVKPNIIADLSHYIETTPLSVFCACLAEVSDVAASPLVRRLRVVVRQWITRPSLQDAMTLLTQQAIGDGEEIQHAFGILKTFVWSLPVLGLIGSVVGIALAVSDFGQLVGTNVDDVTAIKSSLVNVTGGLSYAFTTTLFGLLLALLLLLPSTAVQAREERLLTSAESLVSDIFLPELQRWHPERAALDLMPDTNELRIKMSAVVGDVVKTAGVAAGEVLQLAEARFAAWHRRTVEEGQALADQMAHSAMRFHSELDKATDSLVGAFGDQRDSMNEIAANLSHTVEISVRSSADAAALLRSAIEKQTTGMEAVSSAMVRIQEATQSAKDSHATLARSVDDLVKGDLVARLTVLAEAMTIVARQNEAAAQAMLVLTDTTGRVTEWQRSLQESLKQIEGLGLARALNDLGQTLRQVSGVLAQFREPIVFQAVPFNLPSRTVDTQS